MQHIIGDTLRRYASDGDMISMHDAAQGKVILTS